MREPSHNLVYLPFLLFGAFYFSKITEPNNFPGLESVTLVLTVLFLAVISLFCVQFLAIMDWPEKRAKERILQKQWELEQGRRQLLREIQKQMLVIKKFDNSKNEASYASELMKELAILTHQLPK